MIGFFNILDQSQNYQIFHNSGSSSSWQIWQKPKNSKFVYILCVGGGGGGGCGRSQIVNSAGGGGGGGSSAVTYGLFPSYSLPDILYIQVGRGGQGGSTTGVSGFSGSLSYVSVQPNNTSSNIIVASGTFAGQGGVAGGSVSGGIGGIGGSIFGVSTNAFSNLGIVLTEIGQTGGVGGNTSSNGASISVSGITSGGGGGGGVSSPSSWGNGGTVNGSGFIPTISGGIAGTTGTTGSNGVGLSIPNSLSLSNDNMIFFTGGGGGAAGNIRGGGGGNGNIGSGGGGSGSAYNGTSNPGGNGGNGIVLLLSL